MKKRKVGRPTTFNETKAKAILIEIATSSRGLRKICKRNNISVRTLYRWILGNPTFSTRYREARAAQCEILADQLIELADTPRPSTITKIVSGRRKEIYGRDEVERSKLQINTRQWVLARILNKRFGDHPTDAVGRDNVQELVDEMRKRSGQIGRPEGMEPRLESDSASDAELVQ